jgi:hypothetical protein
MKLLLAVVLIVFLYPSFPLQAQNKIQSSGSASKGIEYWWPMDGNDYVPLTTTFIVRPTKQIMFNRKASDFIFSVQGDKSGSHSGKITISDDDQTIIFKPDMPFALDETIHAVFQIGGENISPLNISFHTTSMSKDAVASALYMLHENEQAEYQSFINESLSVQATFPVVHDSVGGFPPACKVSDSATVHEAGNIFFSPTGGTTLPYSFLGIIGDTSSTALFERDVPGGCGNFRMQPDGTLTYFRQVRTSPVSGVFDGQINHLDNKMNIIDTFQCVGYTADLHDFHLLPNGHSLLVAYDPERVNMVRYLDSLQNPADSALAKKASDTAIVFGAIIQELDQNKNLVFQWRSWDHFQIVETTRDISLIKPLIDYMHINTATLDPYDGSIVASFRHQDEVDKISKTDNSFIWRWGGRHNQFTFTGPNPGDTLKFSHQHDPEILSNTGVFFENITLFDNGNLHTKIVADTIATVPSTRAIEYQIDQLNHIASVVWQYDSLPFCAAAGNVQRLDNNNSLIGLGITVQPSAIEVTPTGEKVFQMSLQTGAFSYRTYRFPFTPVNSVTQTGAASSFGIEQIYPNPAQNAATLSFSVVSSGMINIDLFDAAGRKVRSISERIPNAGTFTLNLDLHDLPNGTYFCKLTQNSNEMTKMIVVQK